MLERLLREGLEGEIVEERYRIRFGPKANLAGFGEGAVLDLEQLPAIQEDRENAGPSLDP
jgi:hypothetical protein